MSVLSPLKRQGVHVFLTPEGGLKVRGSGPEEIKKQAIDYVRQNKKQILAKLRGGFLPGDCDNCPASGFWDHYSYAGQGRLCFHFAYFLGKSGKPAPCLEMRAVCPLKDGAQ